MAKDEKVSTDEKVRRGVASTLGSALLLLLLVGLLAAWAYTGFYQIEPRGGEAAIVLQLGRYRYTEARPGLRWHWPPPIERHEILRMDELASQEFGSPREGIAEAEILSESFMQTRDNNIVNLGFVVQYKKSDAYEARFKVADTRETLRAAAQAAVREVVGRTPIDDVLSEGRGQVEQEARDLLQSILDLYQTGLLVDRVQLQDVQPPAAVSDAFDDVIAAAQDRDRQVQEAEGYANEVLPRARAEARELEEAAIGYRDAKIAEAAGEAERFLAVAAEYKKAPAVTRTRLYLEAMEDVLPHVTKVIIEPGSGALIPYLPLGEGSLGAKR